MKNTNFLSTVRLFFLCRQMLGKESNELFSICLKMISVFILATVVLGFIGVPSYTVAPAFFYLILYLGGIRVAANAFAELRNRDKTSFLIMIPGSVFEKYLSRLLLSSIGFGLIFTFIFFIGVNIGNIINTLAFNSYYSVFIPFSRGNFISSIASYLILHSIFFAGGLYFRKYPIIKTILFVLMIIVLFMICISVISGFAFSYRFSFNIQNFPAVNRYWVLSVSVFYKVLCYCIIPLFCWAIGYLRLKEVEAF